MNASTLAMAGRAALVRPAPPFQEVVERIGQIQRPLPAGTALGIGLAALVAVAFPVTWMFVRYLNTMAHEGTHAAMLSTQGFKVTGVWLHWKDADGATGLHGSGRGVLSIFVGYLGPSLFGLGAAKLISIGHSVAVLWLTLALLVLLLAMVRNPFGILAIVIAGLVIYDFARYGTVGHAMLAAYGIAWILLFSGIRVVLEHWDDAYDASLLEWRTQVVPVTWARIWLVGAIFALLLGARLMM
jgi:hypothetical protein